MDKSRFSLLFTADNAVNYALWSVLKSVPAEGVVSALKGVLKSVPAEVEGEEREAFRAVVT